MHVKYFYSHVIRANLMKDRNPYYPMAGNGSECSIVWFNIPDQFQIEEFSVEFEFVGRVGARSCLSGVHILGP